MATEADLHTELLSLHRRTGEATGYWPNYFYREVKNTRGLTVAKKLLAPGSVSKGFDRLVQVRRADLSVEYIALSDRFSHLFTKPELAVARDRLAALPPEAFPIFAVNDSPFTTDIPPGEYMEGAVVSVPMNRYERSAKAREACLKHHGIRCAVCDLDFSERYGDIGHGFIHVHHKRPLALTRERYRLNAVRDLVPVCPNCHAMLHRRTPPYDVEQLRIELRSV